MWLLLSLLTLLLAIAGALGMRAGPRSPQARTPLEGHSGWQSLEARQGQVRRVQIGVDCATAADFVLRPATALERLAGVVRRRADWNAEGPRLTLVTDDPRIAGVLQATPGLAAGFAPRSDGVTIRQLGCAEGCVWIEAVPTRSLPVGDAALAGLAARGLPVLQALARSLAQHAVEPHAADLRAQRAAGLCGALALALAVFAALHLGRIWMSDFPLVPAGARLWRLALGLGAALILGGWLYVRLTQGPSVRLRTALRRHLLIGVVVTTIAGYVLLREANQTLDFAPATALTATVQSLQHSACGMRRQSICAVVWLRVNDPGGVAPELAGAPRAFRVSDAEAARLPAGAEARVQRHAGALGVPWIAGILPAGTASPSSP